MGDNNNILVIIKWAPSMFTLHNMLSSVRKLVLAVNIFIWLDCREIIPVSRGEEVNKWGVHPPWECRRTIISADCRYRRIIFSIIRFSFSTVFQIPGFFLSDHVSDDSWRWAWDWRTLSWSSSVSPRQCPQAERTLEPQSSWPWSPRTQHCWSMTRGQYQLQCSPCSSQQCQAGGSQSTEIWNI